MSEAGTSRRRSEPSFDEQFENLFAPAVAPAPSARKVPVRPRSGRVAAKAVVALILGIAAGVVFLAIAAIVFALRPR
jgi:hypothetical protein